MKITKQVLSGLLVSVMILSGLSTAHAETLPIHRLAGSDRYETSAQISKASYETSETAVLASGEDFADALAAGPLANVLSSPVLLTAKNELPKAIQQEIKRLEAVHVLIIGGEQAISKEVVIELEKMDLTVERIFGDNRFETANKVVDRLHSERTEKGLPTSSTCGVVNGFTFADALSAVPYLSKDPLLLFQEGETDTTNYERVIVFGGEEAVPGMPERERLAGKDRFLTALEVAKASSQKKVAILANGMSFPDALSATALAEQKNAVILLTKSNQIEPEVVAYIKEHIEVVFVVGGRDVVSCPVIEKILIDEMNPTPVVPNPGDTNPVEPVEPAVETPGTER